MNGRLYKYIMHYSGFIAERKYFSAGVALWTINDNICDNVTGALNI